VNILIGVLVGAGIAMLVFSAVGVLVVRDPFTRLHFLTPASTLGVPLVCLGVILQEGHSRISLKVAIVAVLLLIGQPAVTASTGRAVAAERGLASPQETT
jgi:multicomponent Na+:H+ antiporter subunit G